MKQNYFAMITIALLALLLTAASLSAQNGQPRWPTPNRVSGPLTFNRLFLFVSDNLSQASWWHSQTVVDGAGGVHSVFHTNQNIYYAYCPAGCDLASNWLKVPVAPIGDSLAMPALALDPAGRPRLMWFEDPEYVYAECNSNCTQGSSWTRAEVAVSHLAYNIFPDHSRYFALDQHGHPHFTGRDISGLVYGACDAACTTPTQWQVNQLEFERGLSNVQLALNATGQPRVAGVNNLAQLVYAQCDSACSLSGNWQQVVVAEDVSDNYMGWATFSLRLDQQGRPRIAFYNFVDADTLHYAWSNGNSNSAAGWSSYEMHLPSSEERVVDLALDSHGRPKIVYASDQFNLHYLECTGDCEGPQAAWQVQDVETGQELQASEPVPPCSNCWGATWWLSGHASLALDAADRPHISYDARHVQFWDSNWSYDRWAIRFAQPGDSSGGQHIIYLPLTVR